ncbi:PREDICTED: aprataxin and PNK-like factor [Thamnophis sirtalis]|uniref:Aprataxin and PNK-like factor n=1 Tax=Thamnophis sirtalis TaxID=35019 RepID=A0A6I9YNT5_9SAUR|nr:PREDICTED: aprataxin and PNK-like factor [Thamnophis sirtalis]
MRSQSQPSEQSTISSSKNQLSEVHSLMEKATEIPERFTLPKIEESRPAQRKRQLPEWMLTADLMVSSQSISASKNGSNEEEKPGVSKKQKILESEDSALLKEGVFTKDVAKKMPRNGSKKISQKLESSFEQFNNELDDEEMDLDLKSDEQASQSAQVHTTNIKENKLEIANAKTRQVYKEKPSQSLLSQDDIQETTLNQTTGIDTSNITESQEMQQRISQRISCQYGNSCYRKNPIHFQQFSHPGDSDYHDLEALTQVDDDRPECPYGTACYRKNPQHKLEYKHTTPPESDRRQRSKVTRKVRSVLADESDDDGEANEYNLNDSFIDDEEEEESDPTDEDSDWQPDCQDNDGEDMDMLLKEAQNFVKTKN